jgi:LasA protease
MAARRPMQYRAKQRRIRLVAAWIVLLSFSLSCAIGAGTSTQEFWVPPPPAGMLNLATPTSEVSAVAAQEINTPVPVVMELSEPTPAPEPTPTDTPVIMYISQSGDSLRVVAARWGVDPAEIYSPDPIPETAFFPPNQLLFIPHRLANTTSSVRSIPDSEVVFSPSAVNFDINAYVNEAGGYLSTYKEYLKTTGTTSGADVVARVARENSINPRLLLALLEYQSGWVYGQPGNIAEADYPMGLINLSKRGLYNQLVWAVKQLSIGYYGWREGHITEIYLKNGVTARMAPELNAGTAALQYFFSQLYDIESWIAAMDVDTGLPATHARMYGNPWLRAQTVEPLYPPGLEQPHLILPFRIGQLWSYSGGPHGAWEHEGARAALDFAPGSVESGCVESDAPVLAAAPGLVVRSSPGVVVLDLDGDGHEQTGWVLLYLHISSKKRITEGEWVDTGDFLGHPSCEGGFSTGTHVHIARKYNGEWIPADGPIPFTLGGWTAKAGELPYQGWLIRGDEIRKASVYGEATSNVIRRADDP